MNDLIHPITSWVNGLLETAPGAVLAFVLFWLGIFLKKVPWCPDWLIPFIIIGLAGLIFPFISDLTPFMKSARYPFVVKVIYGLAIGCVPVGGANLWKQFRGRREEAPK